MVLIAIVYFNTVAIFVVQKHYARRLHYDFRLEIGGVLKSWAIPKQPPDIHGIKRLAIETGDHELSYANFEGDIPEGLYGAGIVELWDKGTFEMDEKENDKLVFLLKGKKLEGRYCLIKLHNNTNWLFFKC